MLYTNIADKIPEIFHKEEEKLKNDKNYKVSEERKKEILKTIEEILKKQNKKNYGFFIFELILMLMYWYYITAFCHVFSNSQDSWVFNTVFSILLRFIVNCLVSFLFSIFYKISIEKKSKGLYKCSMFIYNI